MVILDRDEAIVLASYLGLFSLTEEERHLITQDAFDDADMHEYFELKRNTLLRKYLENRFSYYTNKYIQYVLIERLKAPLEVNGGDVELNPCPCCRYMTLKEVGEYCICEVCYWEDDGTHTDEPYSSVNHMTLGEAKRNFEKYGVILEKFKGVVDKSRFIQYALPEK
jgi:hypothetical protein